MMLMRPGAWKRRGTLLNRSRKRRLTSTGETVSSDGAAKVEAALCMRADQIPALATRQAGALWLDGGRRGELMGAMEIFGTLADGRVVERHRLEGVGGVAIDILTLGGVIQRVFAP